MIGVGCSGCVTLFSSLFPSIVCVALPLCSDAYILSEDTWIGPVISRAYYQHWLSVAVIMYSFIPDVSVKNRGARFLVYFCLILLECSSMNYVLILGIDT